MRCVRADGFTLLELLFVIAIMVTIIGIALPITTDAVDALRTQGATRYLAARIVSARMDAVKRSRYIALRFERAVPDYTYRDYADGNHNGVRTADIKAGIDPPLDTAEHIGDSFGGVTLQLMDDTPDADGAMHTGTDGVRIGVAKLLTMGPDGTATSGTLYVRGRNAQYAIRILGVTGRVRVLQYQRRQRQWINR
jgi:prepilin-type N-terminal cleavage/methylation domain-containing protein